MNFLNLSQSFSNHFEGLDFIQKNSVDLVFQDVEMPIIRPQVIFMAVNNEHAISGYDLDALDSVNFTHKKSCPHGRALKKYPSLK